MLFKCSKMRRRVMVTPRSIFFLSMFRRSNFSLSCPLFYLRHNRGKLKVRINNRFIFTYIIHPCVPLCIPNQRIHAPCTHPSPCTSHSLQHFHKLFKPYVHNLNRVLFCHVHYNIRESFRSTKSTSPHEVGKQV